MPPPIQTRRGSLLSSGDDIHSATRTQSFYSNQNLGPRILERGKRTSPSVDGSWMNESSAQNLGNDIDCSERTSSTSNPDVPDVGAGLPIRTASIPNSSVAVASPARDAALPKNPHSNNRNKSNTICITTNDDGEPRSTFIGAVPPRRKKRRSKEVVKSVGKSERKSSEQRVEGGSRSNVKTTGRANLRATSPYIIDHLPVATDKVGPGPSEHPSTLHDTREGIGASLASSQHVKPQNDTSTPPDSRQDYQPVQQQLLADEAANAPVSAEQVKGQSTNKGLQHAVLSTQESVGSGLEPSIPPTVAALHSKKRTDKPDPLRHASSSVIPSPHDAQHNPAIQAGSGALPAPLPQLPSPDSSPRDARPDPPAPRVRRPHLPGSANVDHTGQEDDLGMKCPLLPNEEYEMDGWFDTHSNEIAQLLDEAEGVDSKTRHR